MSQLLPQRVLLDDELVPHLVQVTVLAHEVDLDGVTAHIISVTDLIVIAGVRIHDSHKGGRVQNILLRTWRGWCTSPTKWVMNTRGQGKSP